MKKKSRISKESKAITAQDKMRKFLFGVLLFCVCVMINGFTAQKALAAGAAISVDTKNNKVVKGDAVYVIITVSSSESIKGFEGYFSYDNRILQFVTGGSVVHGNDDEFQISDMERTSSATKIKYSIKFRARKRGSTTIELKKPYNVVADDDSSTKMSVSYNALDVMVVEQENVTNESKTTSPPSPQKTEKPDSSEKKEDKPDAAKKQKEKATAAPESTVNPKSAQKESDTGIGTNLSIEVIDLKEEEAVPAGFEKTEINIDDRTITAYALNGDAESEFVLIYGKAKNKDNEKDKDNEEMFYLYDKNSHTLMPYEKIRSLYRSMNEKDIAENSSERKIQSLKYVIGIMGVFCALMILLAIAIRIRYSNRYR